MKLKPNSFRIKHCALRIEKKSRIDQVRENFSFQKFFYGSRTVEVCGLCRWKVATNVGASSFSVKEDNRDVIEEMRLRIFVKHQVGIFD